MRKVVQARINWLPPEAGGREKPPWNSRYSTVVHFEDDTDNWPQITWSLVVDMTKSIDELLETTTSVWLLAHDDPNAPNHLLHPNSQFELLEGDRIVAKGKVLG